MNNPTQPAQTVRELQQLAVAALDELLSHDLPAVSWDLNQFISRPELSAQVDHGLTDTAKRDVVQKWAKVLKTEVTERFNDSDKYGKFTTVEAVGEFENVDVRVWVHIYPKPDEEVAE